jgi:hypothetical protein
MEQESIETRKTNDATRSKAGGTRHANRPSDGLLETGDHVI